MLRFKWETEFKKTEIGEIPRDWGINKLSYYYNVIMGQSPSSKFYNENGEGIPFVQGNKEFQEVFVKPNIFTSKCHKIAPKNSVLITVRAPVGSLNLAQEEICIGRGVAAINHKNNDIDKNKFCYYLLCGLKSYIARFGERGTTYDSITKDDLENLPMFYPLPKEQSRIATVLSWFDDLIENKKKQNEILEKTAMAIFKSWFVDFEPFKNQKFIYNEELGREVPEGWEMKKVGETVYIEGGGNAPQNESYFENARYPFVRVKHMVDSATIENCDYINEKAIDNYKLKLFSEGSIIIQKSGESLKKARVNLLPFDAAVVNHIAIFDYNHNKNIRGYLFCWLKHILKELIKTQSGTSLPYIKLQDVQDKLLLLPPPQILKRFHSLVEPLFQKIILNQKQMIVLRKVRDALLPQLVFGKLRVVEL